MTGQSHFRSLTPRGRRATGHDGSVYPDLTAAEIAELAALLRRVLDSLPADTASTLDTRTRERLALLAAKLDGDRPAGDPWDRSGPGDPSRRPDARG